MNYLHTSRVAWEASSERLASGGDHLYTDVSPTATATSAPSGSPAEATTSAPDSLTSGDEPPLHRWLASDDGHISVCAMAKRPSPPPSYGGEGKTIQAMELEARRQTTLAVWPVPRSQSSPPTFTRLVIILFLRMLEEEVGHQLM
jgi:hypothetical protein